MHDKTYRGEVDVSPRWDEQDLLLNIDESIQNGDLEMFTVTQINYIEIYTEWLKSRPEESQQAKSWLDRRGITTEEVNAYLNSFKAHCPECQSKSARLTPCNEGDWTRWELACPDCDFVDLDIGEQTREYTFYVEGTHRTCTVTARNAEDAHRDAAFLLVAPPRQVIWLPPLSPFKRTTAEMANDDPATF
jgi:hypothetical protein